jgi:hypothetical protein
MDVILIFFRNPIVFVFYTGRGYPHFLVYSKECLIINLPIQVRFTFWSIITWQISASFPWKINSADLSTEHSSCRHNQNRVISMFMTYSLSKHSFYVYYGRQSQIEILWFFFFKWFISRVLEVNFKNIYRGVYMKKVRVGHSFPDKIEFGAICIFLEQTDMLVHLHIHYLQHLHETTSIASFFFEEKVWEFR